MRIFIGFSELSGYSSRLSTMLARAGHDVCFMDAYWHHYNPVVADEKGLRLVARRWFQWAGRLKTGNKWLYVACSPVFSLVKILVFVSNIIRCDVAIFIGGSTVLPAYSDRRLARLLGLRVINVFLGSTTRPHFMGRAAANIKEPTRQQTRKLAGRLRRQRDRTRAISAACDDVIENPLCSQFHRKPCIDWFQLGFPAGDFSVAGSEDTGAGTQQGRIRILHCPSSPEIKGTREIRACVEHLRDVEKLPVEYTEITGMPHKEVLEQLKTCDFVIDELYSDSPLAGFASEAAWFGKPAIVGGYGWDILASLPSASHAPPSHVCHPTELGDAIRRLVTDDSYRKELGNRAQRYVREFLGAEAYTKRMERVLENRVPDSWRFNPREVCYIHGLGQSEDKLKKLLAAILDNEGMAGFCFSDRPDLQDAISRLIHIENNTDIENNT